MAQTPLSRSRGDGSILEGNSQSAMTKRAFLRAEGLSAEEVRRRPIIGIALTASELNPCNLGLAQLADYVKAGVREAGGLPLEFPTISISEPFTRPTSLYLRNLMSIDVEEMILSTPIDGVILLGGCDKTIPAQIMGALSAGKPAVVLAAGPRPISSFKDNDEFTVDDLWPLCAARRAGVVSDDDWDALEGSIHIGVGTCNVVGTATTMASVAEVLGFALPGSTLPSAASEERRAVAHRTGVQAVETIRAGRTPDQLVTMESLENAFRVVCALGGSTNSVIHLEAIAGRAGLRIGSENYEEWSSTTPYIANVRPGGTELLSGLDEAGGIPAIMQRIEERLNLDALSGTGETWRQRLEAAEFSPHPAITPADAPLSPRGALVMLRGNLAPRGAVFKVAGAHNPRLQAHRGRALVFDGIGDLEARIDDPDLDVDADSILVLRGMGPLGAPGMPEVGNIPIPAKLLRQGITDMVRISDARMSGTVIGTMVLHVTPEAVTGGPLGLLRTGDQIELNVADRTLRHFLTDDELALRTPFENRQRPRRGFGWLHQQHVTQADLGCDFDFLRADFDAEATQ